MLRGRTIWFSGEKGYGFVEDEVSGIQYFCHFSAIQSEGYKELHKGDEVSFDVELGPKDKPQAANVVVLRKAQVA